MARIVVKKDKGPKQVESGAWICMCGLSKNQPYCDGSHKKTLDEGDKVYYYVEERRLTVKDIRTEEGGCKCGAGGCSNCSQK